MATHIPGPAEMKSDWYVLDADSQVLGRLAGRAAVLLMGKHKPDYTPFLATGDHVVVINAAKVRLTGKKEQQKLYRRYSGYPGGLKEANAAKVRATRPERLVEEAILGMLPKNKLGKRLAARLRVYRGAQHPHAAQKPRPA
ncbi:MAG: 50S ribosomal protein L13 [Acidobacteria bacterium]|nr:50S ribosomal protein L13 [Acidobacteriota bacterium]